MAGHQSRYFKPSDLVARTTSSDLEPGFENILEDNFVDQPDKFVSLFYNKDSYRELQSFQEALGAPSLSNFFKLTMDIGAEPPEPIRQFPGDSSSGESLSSSDRKAQGLNQWLTSAGVLGPNDSKQRYELLCNQAMLPGTSMNVSQEIGSRQGIVERFATQRQYTDISIGFYVSSDYKILRLFQEWMNFMNPLYVSQQGVTPPMAFPGGYPSNDEGYAYHRFRYPSQYKKNLAITKFEKNLGTGGDKGGRYNISAVGRKGESYTPDAITYVFVNAFPISIQDIPLNYQAGQILECQVEFTYDRYYIVNHIGDAAKPPNNQGGQITNGSDRQGLPNMQGNKSSGRFLQRLNAS